jgi:hypothetical protein
MFCQTGLPSVQSRPAAETHTTSIQTTTIARTDPLQPDSGPAQDPTCYVCN